MRALVLLLVLAPVLLYGDAAFAQPAESYLLRETFPNGALTPGLWNARINLVTRHDIDPTQHGEALAGFNLLGGGYLHFWDPSKGTPPSLSSRETFAREPGRCLAVAYCGTIHRGAGLTMQFAKAPHFADGQRAGPGWAPAQRQGGPYINSIVPFTANGQGPAQSDNNVDTLLLTVLRKRGEFFLMSGPSSAPPSRARLCFVSHGDTRGPYHAVLRGGAAHARFHGVAVLDLSGPWREEYGLATLIDLFDRETLDRPNRGGGPWRADASWSLKNHKLVCDGDGLLLTDAGSSDAQLEVLATPGPKTTMVGLVLRAKDQDNLLRFELTPEGSRLVERVGGHETVIAASRSNRVRLVAGETHRLAARLEGGWLHLLIDDHRATSSEIHPDDITGVPIDGTSIGLCAIGGEATFDEFINWPLEVDMPESLVGMLPPIPLRADGEIILHDTFVGTDGATLEGRKPTIGNGEWKISSGQWAIEDGAAALDSPSGMALIDTGQTDFELSATIQMNGPPDFPGVIARADKLHPSGKINARFLWQNASPEIEVWDRPADTPENNRRYGSRPTVLINATNITGLIRSSEEHVLRLVLHGNRVSYWCDDLLVGSAPTRTDRGTWAGMALQDHGNRRCRWRDFTVRAFRPHGETAHGR